MFNKNPVLYRERIIFYFIVRLYGNNALQSQAATMTGGLALFN
jgi:hypothetical protein